MILDLKYEHTDFIKHIIPFIKGGIFIDTSVLKIFLDGYIKIRFSKQKDSSYDDLISLFELLQIKNNFSKLLITPHIFTETCSHLNRDYNKREDYKEIIKEVIPFLSDLSEHPSVKKNDILCCVELKKPIIEVGDISIFLSVDNINNSKQKTAILVKDSHFRERYASNPNILIIDFDKTILDLKQI